MKVFAIVTVLLVASANAAFLSSLGNFFTNVLKDFGQTALDTLKNTGVALLKNATSTTANLLAETGQMALFELGNAANGKRDVGDVVKQLEGQFQSELTKAIAAVVKDSETVVASLREVLGKLLNGQLDSSAVLDLLPEFYDAISKIKGDLHDGLFEKMLKMFGEDSHKRELGVLANLQGQLTKFLQPLTQVIEKELGTLTETVGTVAHVLNGEDLENVVKALLAQG